MPDYKVDLVFESLNGGWSESFYYSAADPLTAMNAVSLLCKDRCAILGKSGLMLEIRVSDDAVKGDSVVSTAVQGLANSGLDDDVLNTAALCRIEAGPLHRRGYDIRGLPDDWVVINNQGTNMTLDAVGKRAVSKWLADLSPPAPLQLKVKARRGEAPPRGSRSLENFVIDMEDGGEEGTTTMITLNGLAVDPVVGGIIYFAAARKSAAPINGAWPVIATGTTVGNQRTVTIPLVWGRVSPAVSRDWVKAVGYIPQYFYPAITKAFYERISSRKVGRPFDVPRGRSRPRLR